MTRTKRTAGAGMHARRPRDMAGVLLAGLLVVACGGGTASQVPGQASATAAGATQSPNLGGAGSTPPAPTTRATPAAAATPTAGPTDAATPTPAASPADAVAGTITWNATTTTTANPPQQWIVKGTMHLVLGNDLGVLLATPGQGSYAYDLQEVGCTPGTHQEGTFETAAQTQDGVSVASVLILGGLGADFDMVISSNEHWTATCDGFTSQHDTIGWSFPGCDEAQMGQITAVFDGTSSYFVKCDSTSTIDGINLTGHIEGTLSPAPAP